MKTRVQAKTAFIAVAAMAIIFLESESAYAYIDPGTGGLLYQIVVAFFVVIVSYFTFLSGWIKRILKKQDKNPSNEEDSSD